ncbi:hypothetical protein D7B24_004936 [Verticillium nonalfalfae]|uniref:Inhibitor I9 domain-containing protein n=1 Tax=Verticillium nonalfalfae TaxID=1051616 RepID=A0A3M9YEU1_9PEZI|nr:uncharacterized protein D7B24_004936 [Verticillium nonalfalfae]RNJ58296.1 hypothetical protein D7B24_004936 [Verticillium nonalfalfae]
MRFTALFSVAAAVASTLVSAEKYIIFLKKGASIDEYVAKITAVAPAEVTARFDFFNGLAVETEEHTRDSLAAFPEVESVEVDQIITIGDCNTGPC